ncbi:MAG: murein biosynthesis integral membrane protein MurJ [Paracoccaceae bacterium]
MKPIRLLSGFLTVGFWTLASRVLGFLREVLILNFIGPGPALDAFVAAFRLPNMFRRFFAEGAFNAAFVPMFAKRLEEGDKAVLLAQQAFNLLGFAVLSLVGLGMVFMPALVWVTAEGFYGDPRFDMTVGFGRIVFPYILFMSLAALFSGVLNATGRFAAAAAAPVLLNIFACFALIVGAATGGNVIDWLLWIIPVAGVAQLALVWIASDRAGIKLRPGLPQWNPDMSQLVRVAIPAALASGVMQINLVVGQLVASRTESAVSWLFAADRLYQLPLGVVGIAIGIVLLPDLARKLRAGDESGAREAFSRAGEFSMLLTLPCAVALVLVPLPIVSVLYERGATDSEDVQAIALACLIYGMGLPAFILQKVLQPLYFARGNTKSPFRYALWAMVVNAGGAVLLEPIVGWIAPAIAATTAAWVMIAMLHFGARDMGEAARFDDRFRGRIWRIILASLIMGALIWTVYAFLPAAFVQPGWRYLALAALIFTGMLVFGIAGQSLGAFRISELKNGLRRG